jgi:ABC-type multidrug transport system permease subunit
MTDRRGSPLFELTRARALEFVREPGALFWVFGFPILLAVGLGIAFRNKPPELPRIAVSGRSTADVERTASMLKRSPTLEVRTVEEKEADDVLRTAKVDLLVFVSSASTSYAFRYDPTRPESVTARLAANAALEAASGRRDVLTIEDEKVTQPGSRYIDFLLPGLIGLNLMGSSLWGVGFAVVNMRARKLMKRFAATPMRRSHFLFSFMLSRFFFLFAEVVLLVFFGRVVFDVTVRGSYLDLAILTFAGALSFAGLALFIAARPETVEVASGLMNFAMMPMWLLSGAFFSYERFPQVIQPILRAIPLTALIDGLRAVINDGKGITTLGQELLVLAIWGGVSFSIALRIFRWK